nr:septum formation family protein [Pseudonocardia sp. 73-21]
MPAVPCAQPHEGEVFAGFDLPSGACPGQTQVDSLSETGCGTRFGDYSAADPSTERLFGVYPLESNWARGDREVACIATPLDGGLTTGSLRTS